MRFKGSSWVIGRIAAGIAAAAAALMLVPAAAQAASGDHGKITKPSAQRVCPDIRCGAVATIPAGSWVQTWCWRDAGSYGGTVRWFRVRYGSSNGWVSASQMNPQPVVPYCDSMAPGEALFASESVWSGNGSYRLIMQGDGNLVLYGPSGALWASSTSGAGNRAVMQGDGNLVVYNSVSKPLWATGTAWAGSALVVQNDSNLVMYSGSTPLWASSWHRYTGQATRTWNAGAAGNCTWYAMDRWKGFWSRHLYPAISGDAWSWASSARSLHYLVLPTPATQAVVVFPKTSASPLGHVAWVDAMAPRSDGIYIHIWEMNHVRLGVIDQRWVKVTSGLSFIPAPAI